MELQSWARLSGQAHTHRVKDKAGSHYYVSLSKKVRETTHATKSAHVLGVLNEENITLYTFI